MADQDINAAFRCAQQKKTQNGTNFANGTRPQEQLAVGESATPILPLRYAGGTLGLGGDSEPVIMIVDSSGSRWTTNSVQWALRNIDHFAVGRDQDSLLAGAAMHYGFDDPYALFGRAKFCALDVGPDNVVFVNVARNNRPIRMRLERALLSYEHFGPESQKKLMAALAAQFDLDVTATREGASA